MARGLWQLPLVTAFLLWLAPSALAGITSPANGGVYTILAGQPHVDVPLAWTYPNPAGCKSVQQVTYYETEPGLSELIRSGGELTKSATVSYAKPGTYSARTEFSCIMEGATTGLGDDFFVSKVPLETISFTVVAAAQTPPPPTPSPPSQRLGPGDCSLLLAWKRIRRTSDRKWNSTAVEAAIDALERLEPTSAAGRAARGAMVKYVREYGGLRARSAAARAKGFDVATGKASDLGGSADGHPPGERYFRDAERLNGEAGRYIRDNRDIEGIVGNLVRGCFPNIPPAELKDPQNLIFDDATKRPYRRLRDEFLGHAKSLNIFGALCNVGGFFKHGEASVLTDPAAQFWLYNVATDTADITGIAKKAPRPPDDHCGLVAAGEEGYAYMVAWLFKELASDPPDFEYRRIANPSSVLVLQVKAPAVSSPSVDAFNGLLVNQARQLAYGRALLTSAERAQGAFLDGDTTWRTRQQQAARTFGERLAILMEAEVPLRQSLVAALRAENVGSRVFAPRKQPPNAGSAGQHDARQLALLARLGLPRVGVIEARAVSRPRVPLSARFPDMLATPAHMAAIEGAAKALHAFAASPN